MHNYDSLSFRDIDLMTFFYVSGLATGKTEFGRDKTIHKNYFQLQRFDMYFKLIIHSILLDNEKPLRGYVF